jgi:transcriptional regulator with PAS, ATPase and Fis domain
MPDNPPLPDVATAELTGLLDGYSEPAIALDLDYRILAANRAYRDLYGGGKDHTGRHCYEVSHGYRVPCHEAGESCPLRGCLASGHPQRALHVHHTPRGDEHVDVEIRPIHGQAGDIRYVVEVLRQSRIASTLPVEDRLVGRCDAFNRLIALVHRVAPSDASVVLLGESGTGKELVAQAIHAASPRAKHRFVPVECTGLTESLFESELFGHEKGAFTGAHARKAGLVAAARGGTLFLDEIGDIPLSLQVKLLRLLETGTYRRVGSTEPEQADFRLVCATHQPLQTMMEEGAFRKDLYYRINTFPIRVPALRERQADLPLLVDTLLKRLDLRSKLSLSNDALECLRSYDYPGNIRELRNILERASLMVDGSTILRCHLPEECRCGGEGVPDRDARADDVVALEEVERRYLRQVIARFAGDKRQLANRLGVSERTLYRKIRALSERL